MHNQVMVRNGLNGCNIMKEGRVLLYGILIQCSCVGIQILDIHTLDVCIIWVSTQCLCLGIRYPAAAELCGMCPGIRYQLRFPDSIPMSRQCLQIFRHQLSVWVSVVSRCLDIRCPAIFTSYQVFNVFRCLVSTHKPWCVGVHTMSRFLHRVTSWSAPQRHSEHQCHIVIAGIS